MTQIKIDKGIPIPPPRSGGDRCKYPFADIGVGDSFFVDAPQSRLAVSAVHHSKKSGKKFITRMEGAGTRVWRTE